MNYVAEALRVLVANKLRTFLTLIGLIIGVFAVIAIVTLGNSMAGAIDESLGALTDTSFIIFPSSQQNDIEKSAIRLKDLDTIREEVPMLTAAVPVGGHSDLMRVGHILARLSLAEDSSDPFAKRALAYGRTFDNADIEQARDVAELNWATYQRFFPDGGDPTNASIYAGSHRYLIVGVFAKPRTGLLNAQFGGGMSIPYTTYDREYLIGDKIFAARFTVASADDVTTAETAVIHALRSINHNPNAEYASFDKASFSGGVNQVFIVVTIVVGLIGAVSLLVAGIGVMNIMLVSIAERTREIGTRKAIGATRGQILIQFFIESALISIIGCFVGMVLGLGAGGAINSVFIAKLTGYVAPLPYLNALLITSLFAAIVTLAFGTYPAIRAAALDPIEALRYE